VLFRSNLEAFCQAPGDAVLFCAGDPVQYPECLDVAVVLPELLRVWPGRFRAGVVSPEQEAAVQARYGFQRWPTLIFLRRGEYLGALSGIQDWSVYLARIETLLAGPVSRPPSIGIAVSTAATPTCH
jgi:hydrogenase-1 operon protein HyaE